MSANNIPSASMLWQRHEKLILEVFFIALKLLYEGQFLPEDEDEITEKLSVKARRANFKLNRQDRGLVYPPTWQGQIAPATESEVGSTFTRKKPDFQCQYKNERVKNAEKAYIMYCVECKRLGKTLDSGWNLNKNYVQEGISRFLTAEHSYGKAAESGAMIGYVQNMELDTVTKEINQYITQIKKHKIPPIKFPANDFRREKTASTIQQLKRTEVLPSRFNLRHVWVDLRR